MMVQNGANQYGNSTVENMAFRIASQSPKLNDLAGEHLEQIAKIVMTQNLAAELSGLAKIASIDYKMEKSTFISHSSKTGSKHTQTSYLKALNELEHYTAKNGINILQLTPGQADDFIYSLTGSPNTKSITIAGVSSFYTYLERRHSTIKNPIRGTKARPAKKTVKDIEAPSESELPLILDSMPELEKMAVYVMAFRGLRIGALKNLKIWGSKYQSVSKGKSIFGELPAEIVAGIKSSELNSRTPFESLTTNALKLRIYRHTSKLHREGKIQSAYSAHDFRHYFAISEYKKNKDIYKLSKLLDHTSISITEGYLRSLKLEI